MSSQRDLMARAFICGRAAGADDDVAAAVEAILIDDEKARLATVAGRAAEIKAPVFFHGVYGPDDRMRAQAGHFWCGPFGGRVESYEVPTPWGTSPDGTLALRSGSGAGYSGDGAELAEGRAALHHADGWTALAFWDRSGVDKRGACNSVFVVNNGGAVDFDTMLLIARRDHPVMFDRFPWPIVNVGEVSIVKDRQGRRSTRMVVTQLT